MAVGHSKIRVSDAQQTMDQRSRKVRVKKASLMVRKVGERQYCVVAVPSGYVLKRYDAEQDAIEAMNDPVKRMFWEVWGSNEMIFE